MRRRRCLALARHLVCRCVRGTVRSFVSFWSFVVDVS
jgi:hypothetical protein